MARLTGTHSTLRHTGTTRTLTSTGTVTGAGLRAAVGWDDTGTWDAGVWE